MHEITTEGWLAELKRLESSQALQEGFTIREISDSIGRPLNATRRIIEGLIKCGRVESLKVKRTSLLNGVTRPVPGFKLVKRKGTVK